MKRTATRAPSAPRLPTITDEELDAFFTTAPPRPAPPAPVALAEPPADLDDLFPPKSAPLLPPAPVALRWRGCVVCGARDSLRAHPAHDVCLTCATAPDAARARLELHRRALVEQQHAAARLAQAAYDALDEAETTRWARICTLRAARDAGQATPEEAALVARTLRGLRDTTDARFSAALRACLHADECLYWANQANQHGQAKINAQLAQLALCVEDIRP